MQVSFGVYVAVAVNFFSAIYCRSPSFVSRQPPSLTVTTATHSFNDLNTSIANPGRGRGRTKRQNRKLEEEVLTKGEYFDFGRKGQQIFRQKVSKCRGVRCPPDKQIICPYPGKNEDYHNVYLLDEDDIGHEMELHQLIEEGLLMPGMSNVFQDLGINLETLVERRQVGNIQWVWSKKQQEWTDSLLKVNVNVYVSVDPNAQDGFIIITGIHSDSEKDLTGDDRRLHFSNHIMCLLKNVRNGWGGRMDNIKFVIVDNITNHGTAKMIRDSRAEISKRCPGLLLPSDQANKKKLSLQLPWQSQPSSDCARLEAYWATVLFGVRNGKFVPYLLHDHFISMGYRYYSTVHSWVDGSDEYGALIGVADWNHILAFQLDIFPSR